MFYSTQILGRKGPLAVIWIAAHKDQKFLKRALVDTTSVNDACGAPPPPPPPSFTQTYTPANPPLPRCWLEHSIQSTQP